MLGIGSFYLCAEIRNRLIAPAPSTLDIYTDGGCHKNPGTGGWAYVLVSSTGEVIRETYGGERNTTNNRMEMLAAVEALRAVKALPSLPEAITLYTDSSYLKSGITSWIVKWKQNNWLTSEKKPVKNVDLWRELDALGRDLPLTWRWVKGHAGNEHNERCDTLTQRAIKEQGR
jgi:ribonuclease HI